MMLSRVAERLYWMGRYLERAEDASRLINAYSHLILDIPRGTEPGWDVLVRTFDAEVAFANRYRKPTERNVIKFLLDDADNASSIRSTIAAARENVRTTRDALPALTWKLVNELNLYANENAPQSLARSHRFELLDTVIARNQQINGLIDTTVMRGHSLWFIRLGQLIERADMTSRVVDVATAAIGERSSPELPEIPLLWAYLLASLSSRTAYRRSIGPVVDGDEVIRFVFLAHRFPRSITYCLNGIEEIVGFLNAPSGLFRDLRSLLRLVSRVDRALDSLSDLHCLIDDLQAGLATVHDVLEEEWFAVPRA